MGMLVKTRVLLFLFLCILCTGLSAQSTAVEVENLLATDAVTYGQAVRFVLVASGKMSTYNQQESFRYAAQRGWLSDKVTANQTARLDDISLLILKAFDVKGGLFYSIVNNPHYAYRELVYLNYIYGRSDPAMDVSGELLLFIIGKLLTDDNNDTLAAQREEDARREAELAAMNEAARREAELAAQREADARREAELAAMDETARREAELTATDDTDCNELAAQREESARLEAQLAAQRDEAIRLEAQLAAQREELARREAQLSASNRQIRTPVILFTADNTVISDAEKVKLREFAELLKNIPGVKLRISGYAAQAGTRAGRTRISLGRAQNVANYLISLGAVNAANITVIGYGSERPVASNATPRGMAANRRVEITILED
jgi:outer membrane protein OmpA-like peptidoglycan-associated protein